MTAQFFELPDGSTLHSHIDGELVAFVERDPSWSTTDQHGHPHYWTANPDLPYPTIESRHRGCDIEGHDDCEGDVFYVCRECGDEVEPGMRTTTRSVVRSEWYELTVRRREGQATVTTTYTLSKSDCDALMHALTATAMVVIDRQVGEFPILNIEATSA